MSVADSRQVDTLKSFLEVAGFQFTAFAVEDNHEELSRPKPTALTASALKALDSQLSQNVSSSHLENPIETEDIPEAPYASSIHDKLISAAKFTQKLLGNITGRKRSHQELSQPSMISQPRNATEYIVDGVVYRSPDTVGTLIEVQRSEGKGYGIFALKDIPIGTVLLSEAPLVTLMDDGARVDPLDSLVNNLSPAQRKAYRSLHGYRRNKSDSLNRCILYSNGFSLSKKASGVFEIASRINHSCVPNSTYEWHEDVGRMVYINHDKLMVGEEVTIDYGHKKGLLQKYYGFVCDCGGCTEWGSVTTTNTASSLGGRLSEGGKDKEILELPNLDTLVLEEKSVANGDLKWEEKENSKDEAKIEREKSSEQ